MPVKKMKPTSPGRRFMTISSFEEITKTEPEKVLTESLKRHSGRNNQGRVTVRHRGGGHKRLYRRIDFKRDKDNMPAKVIAVEYDPNRSARIALLQYEDSERRYILHPVGLNVGDVVASGADAEFGPGNCLPLENIPDGTVVHAIEMMPGRGAQLCRSAGASAQLMAKEGRHALLRLPSGEMRLVPRMGRATIGQVGNTDHELINIGKAGRNRHLGWRPTVRGSAMNVDDHPHGGGEGKAPIGMPSPKSPWGWRTRGRITRKRNNASDQFIVQSRRKKRK